MAENEFCQASVTSAWACDMTDAREAVKSILSEQSGELKDDLLGNLGMVHSSLEWLASGSATVPPTASPSRSATDSLDHWLKSGRNSPTSYAESLDGWLAAGTGDWCKNCPGTPVSRYTSPPPSPEVHCVHGDWNRLLDDIDVRETQTPGSLDDIIQQEQDDHPSCQEPSSPTPSPQKMSDEMEAVVCEPDANTEKDCEGGVELVDGEIVEENCPSVQKSDWNSLLSNIGVGGELLASKASVNNPKESEIKKKVKSPTLGGKRKGRKRVSGDEEAVPNKRGKKKSEGQKSEIVSLSE